jgi:hypothetical protein
MKNIIAPGTILDIVKRDFDTNSDFFKIYKKINL